MAKIVGLKGIISAIGPVTELTDEKKTKIQYLVLNVAGYTDSYGEKRGKDQQWLLQLLGNRITELNLQPDWETKKAEVDIYTECYCIPSKEPGRDPFYATNHTLAAIKIIP